MNRNLLRVINFSLVHLLTIIFLVSCISCGLDVEDPTPPSKPQWIEKSLPEEWPERGIDAHESGGIFIEWEPNYTEDIIAYTIHRAMNYEVNDSIGDYNLLTRLEIKSTPEPEYIDRSAGHGVTYFYKIRAEDASDNLSEFSDSVYYALLPPVRIESMIPNGVADTINDNLNLSWVGSLDNEFQDYILSILTDDNELVKRITFLPTTYTGDRENRQIPSDVVLTSGEVYKWRIDLGANYYDERESHGAESAWATFFYD